MAAVFWDCQGLLLREFLLPETTINGDKYCETLKSCAKPLNGRDQYD
jgi:hypothetical protein